MNILTCTYNAVWVHRGHSRSWFAFCPLGKEIQFLRITLKVKNNRIGW
jgi:hypothetical protein